MAGRELAWRLFVRNLARAVPANIAGPVLGLSAADCQYGNVDFSEKRGVFETGDTQVNATVYILTGMILWQAFIEAFQMPLNMVNKNGNMLSKLNFPRESLLLVGIG